MKKLFVVLIVMSMCINICSIMAEDSLKNESRINQIDTQESFTSLFINNYSNDKKINTFETDYELEDCNLRNGTFRLDTTLYINGNSVDYSVFGNYLNPYIVKGNIYVYDMSGNIEINNTDYLVLSNISIDISSGKKQICTTIQSYPEDANMINPVCFTYGDDVLTRNTFETLLLDNQEYNNYEFTRSFSLIGSTNTGFASSGISGYGQQIRVYSEQTSRRIAVAIKSYTNNVKNYYLNDGTNPLSVIAYVKSLSMKLNRNTTVNTHTYIAGIENHGFNVFNQNVEILDLFDWILEAMGIPSISISTILGSAVAKVSEISRSDLSQVTVSNMTASTTVNIDSINCGLPIVFQMDKVSSGADSYTATTTLQYGIIYVPNSPTPTAARLYYVNANNANYNFNISY